MAEIELEKLMKGITDPKVGANANSITGMLTEFNSGLEKAQTTIHLLKETGLFPLIVRGIGKKMGIDAETPLKSDLSVAPKSDVHRTLMNAINMMNDEQLGQFAEALKNGSKKSETGNAGDK